MANRPRVSEQSLSDFLDAGGRRDVSPTTAAAALMAIVWFSASRFSAVGIEVHVEGAVGQRREPVHPRPVLEVAECGFIDEQVAGVGAGPMCVPSGIDRIMSAPRAMATTDPIQRRDWR